MNYFETNIEPLDLSATPMLRSSQLRASRSEESGKTYYNGQESDWLSCIAKKTGAPRMFLAVLILLCSLVMIWLCLTAANTAHEQRVKPEKLSINGDLDYLKELEENGVYLYSPQDKIQADPLPIKIKVQKI